MISGYRCKLRQVPLKVLPFCRVPVKFIGYLTRPLGFFFVSVDTEKVTKRHQRRCHAAQDRSWGLTFAKFCGIQRLIRDWSAMRIYCRVLFGCWNNTFYRVIFDDLFCLPDGSICRVIRVTRNILTSVFFILIKIHRAREQRSRWE